MPVYHVEAGLSLLLECEICMRNTHAGVPGRGGRERAAGVRGGEPQGHDPALEDGNQVYAINLSRDQASHWRHGDFKGQCHEILTMFCHDDHPSGALFHMLKYFCKRIQFHGNIFACAKTLQCHL